MNTTAPSPPPATSDPSPAVAQAAVQDTVKHLELKAALLVGFMVLLMTFSALYVLYARGAFEPTQRLVLTSDDAEGAVVGMNLTFSGFAIGRVRKIELAPDGTAHIHIDIASKDAHWLRTSSVFAMVRGLVGGTNIRAYTGVMTDPVLPDGAKREVLRGDATADIPRVVSQVKELLDNLNGMTSKEAPLNKTMVQVQKLTETINGPGGAVGAVFGSEGAERQKIMQALERTNSLLARLDGVAAKADTLVGSTNALVGKASTLTGNADAQVFGDGGAMSDVKANLKTLNALLEDTRQSLKKMDAVLLEAQGVGSNVRSATADMGGLRADVEANLRKIEGMVNDINRKWPFAKEVELKLP